MAGISCTQGVVRCGPSDERTPNKKKKNCVIALNKHLLQDVSNSTNDTRTVYLKARTSAVPLPAIGIKERFGKIPLCHVYAKLKHIQSHSLTKKTAAKFETHLQDD